MTGPVSVPGLCFALAAYTIWGLFPLYFKHLAQVPFLEVVGHRILWTLPFVAVVLQVTGRWGPVQRAFMDPRQLALLALSALLIGFNWSIYIWAVTSDRVLDASLGYYLTPLVSIAIGVLALGERVRRAQWLAVMLATLGVLTLLLDSALFPWAGLSVAVSFGLYGALRKRAVVESGAGLFVETALLAPLALIGLAVLGAVDGSQFIEGGATTTLLLMGAGVMTGVPLLFYVAGARRLRLFTVGTLFYITPTIQFLLATLLYREPLSWARMTTFVLIWAGLAVLLVEARWHERAGSRDLAAAAETRG